MKLSTAWATWLGRTTGGHRSLPFLQETHAMLTGPSSRLGRGKGVGAVLAQHSTFGGPGNNPTLSASSASPQMRQGCGGEGSCWHLRLGLPLRPRMLGLVSEAPPPRPWAATLCREGRPPRGTTASWPEAAQRLWAQAWVHSALLGWSLRAPSQLSWEGAPEPRSRGRPSHTSPLSLFQPPESRLPQLRTGGG